MTPAEVARVLAKCAAYDRRTVGEADVRAWYDILADIDYADALTAVGLHYRSTSKWAMPADILADAREAKRTRLRHSNGRPEVLALPSRYEPDAERDARARRGRALCEAAIRTTRAATSIEPEGAIP